MDSDSERQENQRILVGEKVMIAALIIVLLLIMLSIIGIIYVAYVHFTLKKEYEEKQYVDNSEFDYGHNVRHYYTEF